MPVKGGAGNKFAKEVIILLYSDSDFLNYTCDPSFFLKSRNMRQEILKLIEKECRKRILKNNKRLLRKTQAMKTKERATGRKFPQREIKKAPAIWLCEKQYNPYYVLANASFLSRAVTKAIKAGTYRPKPSISFNIAKKDSQKTREINMFSIIDSAVAKWINTTLLKNNSALLSPYSFAYRKDRNGNHAIHHLHLASTEHHKMFIGEFDFSNFHSNIPHERLRSVLKARFTISDTEWNVINSFLIHQKASPKSYEKNEFEVNSHGLPQGSAISMTLANMYVYPLDNRLEKSGANFARFSDDIVIVTENEAVANKCENILFDEATLSEFVINKEKSNGISTLTFNPLNSSRNVKTSFDFLGHRLSDDISIAEKSVNRIKKRLTQIINQHLIYYPKKHGFSHKRYLSSLKIDWDLVNCIKAIRRYVYGTITEEKISTCLKDKSEPMKMSRSLLTYFPLVNNGNAFKALDGWLCYTLFYALKARAKILSQYIEDYQIPSKEELISGLWYNGKYAIETKLPSFFKAWLYVQEMRKRGKRLDQFPTQSYY